MCAVIVLTYNHGNTYGAENGIGFVKASVKEQMERNNVAGIYTQAQEKGLD